MVNLTVPNNKSKVAASFFVFFFYIFHSISCIFSHFFLTTLSFFFLPSLPLSGKKVRFRMRRDATL